MLNIIQGLKLHEIYCQVGHCKENIIKLKYWEVNIEEIEILGNTLRVKKKMLCRNQYKHWGKRDR